MDSPRPNEKEPAGVMVSIVIIVLLIFAGAYYFSRRVPLSVEEPITEETDPMVAALSTQGTSDEVVDIQRDIDATPDLSVIGADLVNVQP